MHEMFNISSKGIALQQEVYFNSQVNVTQPLMSTFYRGEIAKRIVTPEKIVASLGRIVNTDLASVVNNIKNAGNC